MTDKKRPAPLSAEETATVRTGLNHSTHLPLADRHSMSRAADLKHQPKQDLVVIKPATPPAEGRRFEHRLLANLTPEETRLVESMIQQGQKERG